MKKKLCSVIYAVLIFTLLFAGCSKQERDSEKVQESTVDFSGESFTIGILQFADHAALNDCKKGFLEILAADGLVEGENLTLIDQNAGSEIGRAKQITTSLLSSEPDLVLSIGTTSAQYANQMFMHSDIPIVFAAVTDPITAELADEDGVQRMEITGVSNKAMVEEQLELIHNVMPDAKKIGIIYSVEETNAKAIMEEYRNNIADYDMELVTRGIDAVQNISLTADEILPRVDCIVNIPDNGVTSSLETLLEKANVMQVPVFGCDINQARMGCIAAVGVDYMELGKQAGRMSVQILSGEKKASEIKFCEMNVSQTYYNRAVAEALGLEISEDEIERATEVFDMIEEQ